MLSANLERLLDIAVFNGEILEEEAEQIVNKKKFGDALARRIEITCIHDQKQDGNSKPKVCFVCEEHASMARGQK